MKNNIFYKSLIGATGGVSSKRIIQYWLIVLFSVVVLLNIIWGKTIDQTLKEYLFYLILAIFGFTTSDNIVKANKDVKIARKGTPDINVTTNKADEITQVNVEDEKPKE